MMMGHHGLGMLMRLAEEALAENRRRRGGEGWGPVPEGERLGEELRTLYARGDLDRESFLQMREMAERGELTRSDLEEARQQAEESRALDSPEARKVGAALARLKRQRKALESAWAGSEATVGRLQAEAEELGAQARRDEDEARRVVLADEAAARALLEHRETLIEHERALREEIDGLRSDLRRMEDLQRELRLQEQSLEVELSRARLGKLERQVRGDAWRKPPR